MQMGINIIEQQYKIVYNAWQLQNQTIGKLQPLVSYKINKQTRTCPQSHSLSIRITNQNCWGQTWQL